MRSASISSYASYAKVCKWSALAVTAACIIACSSKPASSVAAAGDTRIVRFALSPDSFTLDKVGGSDGSLDPNGIPDAVMRATTEGSAIGVVLLARDAQETAVAQWDTLTGADTFPSGASLYS